jgi:hypothetical protein
LTNGSDGPQNPENIDHKTVESFSSEWEKFDQSSLDIGFGGLARRLAWTLPASR